MGDFKVKKTKKKNNPKLGKNFKIFIIKELFLLQRLNWAIIFRHFSPQKIHRRKLDFNYILYVIQSALFYSLKNNADCTT